MDYRYEDDEYAATDPFPIDFSMQTGFLDCGLPHVTKNFIAALVEFSSPATLDIDFKVDNRYDSDDDSSWDPSKLSQDNLFQWYDGTSSPTPDNMKWNDASDTYETYWGGVNDTASLVYLNDKAWGRRISLTISGSVTNEAEILSITIFYVPQKGVRE
jgi:hypothetical protein